MCFLLSNGKDNYLKPESATVLPSGLTKETHSTLGVSPQF